MTARDFTPTDEQWEALWQVVSDARDAHERSTRDVDSGALLDTLLASPAFQSIIAAAKAEARAEIATQIEAVDMWVEDETSEYVFGSDDAARAIVAFIRKQNEASA